MVLADLVRAPRLNGALRRVAHEPLVHFLVLGVLIFAGVSLVRGLERPTVTIDAQELNQLAEYWALQAQRPPTRAELAAIIQTRVDEEVLAREALRLGLDKGDLIIRRRLAQKMAFASEDAATPAAEPDEATLRAAFDRTRGRYAAPTRATLRHALYSADRGRDAARAAAVAALARAQAGTEPAGDPSLLPLAYADASLDDLARDYGAEFAQAVAQAPLGRWVGPVASGFGQHLIRVERRIAPAAARFEDVRGQVRDAWLAERRRAANEDALRALRRRYRIVVAGAPA